ncbi:MAG TPA: DUF512 domain-containing protein [Blastocatellia bacterium]|nr:DUF512 domain-containing protein [Blastocatellia bacterium]
MQHLLVPTEVLFGKRTKGVKIIDVAPGSLGAELELQPGDTILSVNGRQLRDFIDFRFCAGSEDEVTLEVIRADGEKWQLEVEKAEDEDWGLDFEHFKPRQCANDCIFCFCKQNPPGSRESLWFRDEDIRLSFLYGNYTTMTSMSRQEMRRIVEQRLTPQYVSVHATDLAVRAILLGNDKRDDVLAKIRYFIENGIDIHAQVVLCPGINDGDVLKRTIYDLADLHPGLVSTAIVPLGITDHHTEKDKLTLVSDDWCREVIAQVSPWQEEFRKRLGFTFAFLGDEIYLRAGQPIPLKSHYGEYPQIEDGVGMVRLFLEDLKKLLKSRKSKPNKRIRGTVATGKLFYPALREALTQINDRFETELKPLAITNRYFGEGVTVAGLLSGGDFLKTRSEIQGDFFVIPESSTNEEGSLFLDNSTVADLRAELGIPVIKGGRTPTELLDRLVTQY